MSGTKPPIILLIGAHRSGTSLLAQIFSIMGLDLGRSLMPPSYDNPRGFWENEKIVQVHDSLLKALGRDWTTACFLNEKWVVRKDAKRAVDQLVDILQSDFFDGRASLIKDPRLAALYPVWVDVAKKLGRKLKVIGIVRSVDQVSKSLMRRNRFEPDVAELIAVSYMNSASKVFMQSKAKIVNYESLTATSAEDIVTQLATLIAPVPAITAATTVEMIKRLVLPGEAGRPINADLQALHSQHIGSSRLKLTPNRVGKYAAAASEQIGFDERKKGFARKTSLIVEDWVREEDLLGRVIDLNKELFSADQRNQDLVSNLEATSEKLGAMEGGIAERDEEIKRLHSEVADVGRRIGALKGGVTERDDEIKRLHDQAATAKEKISALEGGIGERDEELHKLQIEVASTRERLGAIEGGITERDTEIKRLHGDMARKEQRIGALEGGITERDAELLQLLSDISANALQVSQLQGGIRERDSEIEKLQSTMTEQDSSLDKIRDEFQDRESKLELLNQKLVQRDEELSALKTELAMRDGSLKSLQERIDKKSDALSELERGLMGHNQKMASLNDQLKSKGDQIGDLETNLSDREAYIEQLHSELTQKDKAILSHNETLAENAELAERIIHFEQELLKQGEQFQYLDKELVERGEQIHRLDKELVERGEQIHRLDKELVERGEQIHRLDKELVERGEHAQRLDREIVERGEHIQHLDKELVEQREHVQHLDQLLYEANEGKQNLSVEVEDLRRKYEALVLSNELNDTRGRLIELELNEKVGVLNNRLEYYQNHTIRAAIKSSLYSSLRGIKRALPIPKSAQMSLSRRVVGLTQRLRPPHLIGPITPVVTVQSSGTAQLDFQFAETDNPKISVIVPVYNEIAQTISCLKSVYQQQVSVPYEVIIADDASPDPFHVALQDVKGARYFRSPENLGFLMNCNTHAQHARGEYIVFLNNDTLVHPAWLESLYQTFLQHDNVGIAGSKLVFPSGELQEAGGIIWEDGSGWNWGRGNNANHPKYNYVRDVDYVSGAALMINTELFRSIGGFYSELEQAYYEDTDCCFRVREQGYRVVYQPHSVVTHIEGLSSGTDLNTGPKKYQLSNQKIFRETWSHVLRDHLPNGETPEIASDRKVKGHILYVDATTPTPDQDSGSLDALNAMTILSELGYRVHFIPGTNFAFMGDATKRLQAIGVECIYHPYYSNMASFLKERGDAFDFVILSRAEVNDLFLDQIKKNCPSAKIIYNTVDLHFLRQQREAELSGNSQEKDGADIMRAKELKFMRESHATILLSEHEREVLNGLDGLDGKLFNIPLIREETSRAVTYEGSQDIVFIGGYNHPPNVDAVEWLVSDIWPQVRKQLPEAKLLICGSAMPEFFNDFAADDIVIKGYIPNLDRLLSTARLTVAPLRYGAGLKGKVASSIGIGVPCVGTSIAFEGMAKKGLDLVKLEAATPEEFAALIKDVYNDKERWNLISEAGTRYHNENYGKRAISELYNHLLESLKNEWKL